MGHKVGTKRMLIESHQDANGNKANQKASNKSPKKNVRR